MNLTRPSAARSAALLVFNQGPKTREELFTAINFGTGNAKRLATLEKAVSEGYLEVRADGKYDLTQRCFEELESEGSTVPKQESIGSVALPNQFSVFDRPTYVPPPRRIPRDDEPAWSKRAGCA
jgi:hypothetical protein